MNVRIFYMISANKKTSGQDPFVILYLSALELRKYISKLEKKSSGLDGGISNHLLNLSLPYIIDLLTYIFDLGTDENKTKIHLSLAKPKEVPFSKSKI